MNITIGWLYPDLMSTYGDRGNVICLSKRCFWRKIDLKVKRIEGETSLPELESCDLIFGGGAQDRQQAIVMKDLVKKRKSLQAMFDRNIPGLFVCGAPQLLGRPFLGIFDMETKYPSGPRLIGNLVAKINSSLTINDEPVSDTMNYIVGFENHGGRTYLGKGVKPLAKVIKGFGNNGEDETEGAVYNNCLATYSHGPFLPKNPILADWLISKALKIKYQKDIKLPKIDDELENKAHEFILKKMGVRINRKQYET